MACPLIFSHFGWYCSRQWDVKHASFAKTIAVGMDTIQRRSRNPKKLQREAEALLQAEPWRQDPNLEPAVNLRITMNQLSDFPFHSVCAQANHCLQTTPFWLIHDKEGNVLFRFTSHLSDCRMRDVLLPYLMGVQKIEPLITVAKRNQVLADYRASKKYAPGQHRGDVVVHSK